MAETNGRPAAVVLGLPTDAASSFERGAAAGPRAIRSALYSPSSNLMTESGLDLGADDRWRDLGDLDLPSGEGQGDVVRTEIERAVSRELAGGARFLGFGGDHSVTYPVLRAHSSHRPGLTIVQVDAHPDLYDNFEGDRFSHACPFARIMEETLAVRLIQIGIRTATAHQLQQAKRFGVEILPRAQWLDLEPLEIRPPVYLSIDLDGLDPAFAPGVSHPEAGGLSTRDVLEVIDRMPELAGADIVELNPSRDVRGITAAAAGKIAKELLARLLEPSATPSPTVGAPA